MDSIAVYLHSMWRELHASNTFYNIIRCFTEKQIDSQTEKQRRAVCEGGITKLIEQHFVSPQFCHFFSKMRVKTILSSPRGFASANGQKNVDVLSDSQRNWKYYDDNKLYPGTVTINANNEGGKHSNGSEHSDSGSHTPQSEWSDVSLEKQKRDLETCDIEYEEQADEFLLYYDPNEINHNATDNTMLENKSPTTDCNVTNERINEKVQADTDTVNTVDRFKSVKGTSLNMCIDLQSESHKEKKSVSKSLSLRVNHKPLMTGARNSSPKRSHTSPRTPRSPKSLSPYPLMLSKSTPSTPNHNSKSGCRIKTENIYEEIQFNSTPSTPKSSYMPEAFVSREIEEGKKEINLIKIMSFCNCCTDELLWHICEL